MAPSPDPGELPDRDSVRELVHEIKTPLSVIRGYVSLLLDGIYGEVTEAQRQANPPVYHSVVRTVAQGRNSAQSVLAGIRPLTWKGSADLFTLAAANALLVRGEKRFDSVAALVDEGEYAKARETLSGTRWLEGVDPSVVPRAPLRRAQQWIDAAYDSVGLRDVDVHLVQRLLLEARRALASP